MLERWAAAVPAARVHVVTVPPPDAPRPLLWTRWCEMLGLDDSTFDHDVHYANESLGAAQAALLHRRQAAPHRRRSTTGAVRHRWVRRYFGHEVLVPQEGARFALTHPTTPPALRELSKEAAEAVATGGYDVTGDRRRPRARRHAAGRTGRTRTTCRRASCSTWRRRRSTA